MFLFCCNLSVANDGPTHPHRAGTTAQVAPGPLLQAAIERIEERRTTEQNNRSTDKVASSAVRAGTLPKPCHKPDNHPHEGHSHQGKSNPYSAKKH